MRTIESLIELSKRVTRPRLIFVPFEEFKRLTIDMELAHFTPLGDHGPTYQLSFRYRVFVRPIIDRSSYTPSYTK